MTTEQIKNTEMTSQDIVSRNMDVYAKESSLAMAKDIQGLRAIFEEVGTDLLKKCGIHEFDTEPSKLVKKNDVLNPGVVVGQF